MRWHHDVERARSGDAAAFGSVVAHFQDMAYAVALSRLADSGRAEDAAQEAFIDAFVHIGTLKETAAFPGWLRTIVERQCGKEGRKTGRETEIDEDVEAPATQVVDGDVWKFLDELSEAHRLVLVMHYVADYEQADIASFLDVPLTTVKKRLHDGKAKLRTLLETERAGRPSRSSLFADAARMAGACIAGDRALVESLLTKDARLVKSHGEVDEVHMRQAKAHWGWTPLHLAAHYGHLDLVKLLVARGAEIESKALNSVGNTALGAAIWGDRVDVVRFLLERGAATDRLNAFGQTPLHRAVQRGNLDIVRLLLAHQAKGSETMYDFLSQDGWSALHLAAFFGHAPVVAALLDAGANPLVVSKNHEANVPLNAAAAGRRNDVVKMFVERGVPVDARGTDAGYTALHLAAHHGDAELVKWLVGKGASKTLKTGKGETAAALAKAAGFAELAAELAAELG